MLISFVLFSRGCDSHSFRQHT